MLGQEGRTVEDTLRDLLLTDIPEGKRRPAGQATGGAVYYHPLKGSRSTLFSESADTPEEWAISVDDLLQRMLPLPHPGSYSVQVTATSKINAKDMFNAGTFKISEEDHQWSMGGAEEYEEVGGVGGGLSLHGNLGDLTEAKSAKVLIYSLNSLVGSVKQMADTLNKNFDARHDEQNKREEDFRERELQLRKDRHHLLGLMGDTWDEHKAWGESKMGMLEKAPGQMIELVGMVGNFITGGESDDETEEN